MCNMLLEESCAICYYNHVRRATDWQIKSPGATNTGAEGGEDMRYHLGMWYYQGKTYNSLHEALVANWAK